MTMPESTKYTHETLRALVGVWIDPLSEVGLATLVNAHADAWKEQLAASEFGVQDAAERQQQRRWDALSEPPGTAEGEEGT